MFRWSRWGGRQTRLKLLLCVSVLFSTSCIGTAFVTKTDTQKTLENKAWPIDGYRISSGYEVRFKPERKCEESTLTKTTTTAKKLKKGSIIGALLGLGVGTYIVSELEVKPV